MLRSSTAICVAMIIGPISTTGHGQPKEPAVLFYEDYSKPLTVSRKWDPGRSNIHGNPGYAGVRWSTRWSRSPTRRREGRTDRGPRVPTDDCLQSACGCGAHLSDPDAAALPWTADRRCHDQAEAGALPKKQDTLLLVDDIMLCPAATEVEYAPRTAVELRLRSRAPRGVHLPSEAVHLDIALWNPRKLPAPQEIGVVVFDEAGNEQLRRRAAIAQDGKGSCTIEDLPTGYWRIETRTGLAKDQCSEAEAFIVVAPPMPRVPDAEFSLGSHMSNNEPALRSAYRLGIRWDRFH